MRIDRINLYHVELPFSGEFSHSLRKRFSAKNVVVEVIGDQNGIRGYGEGAPRSYVTGETQESVASSVRNLVGEKAFPWNLSDISQVWDFVDSLSNGKDENSAICALEMALLDALARKQDRPIIEYFPSDYLTDTIYYGAPIPLGDREKITRICRLIKQMNIKKLRIKMATDLEENAERIDTVRMLAGGDCDLRLDVNDAWNRELAFAHIPLIREHRARVVEQPMVPGNPDIAEFSKEIKDCGVVLMADEAACSIRDVKRIVKDGFYGMINIRLSKCGGFRRALKIIGFLRENGISFQIGCQLGESGILSAAGRTLCLLCGDAVYYDGSYDEFLLKENTTLKSVSFGVGGKAGLLAGTGLGVKVDRKGLERLSNSRKITIKNPKR